MTKEGKQQQERREARVVRKMQEQSGRREAPRGRKEGGKAREKQRDNEENRVTKSCQLPEEKLECNGRIVFCLHNSE